VADNVAEKGAVNDVDEKGDEGVKGKVGNATDNVGGADAEADGGGSGIFEVGEADITGDNVVDIGVGFLATVEVGGEKRDEENVGETPRCAREVVLVIAAAVGIGTFDIGVANSDCCVGAGVVSGFFAKEGEREGDVGLVF
jgi:hypothetical protein